MPEQEVFTPSETILLNGFLFAESRDPLHAFPLPLLGDQRFADEKELAKKMLTAAFFANIENGFARRQLEMELPLSYFSDLSLTAPLKVAYRKTNSITAVPYLYIYPTTRYRAQESLIMPTNQPVTQYLYIGQFNGNTSRSITIYFSPPACLRVIDPEIELNNWMVPLYVRQTAALPTESSRLINSSSEPNFLAPIFTDEPKNNWCHAFEKADLARQTQNWPEVIAIADEVITGEEKPVDPMERLVYIEGYAHTGHWEKSIALTETTLAVTGAMRPPLCSLWQRIESQTHASEIKNESITHVQRVLNCEKE